MHHKGILYSLGYSISDLKSDQHIIYDTASYTNIETWMQKEQVWVIIGPEHPRFSPIKPQPYLLYYLWDITLLDKKILGIVGPRKMSSYGQKVIESLFWSAQDYDIVTISGMAEGIDSLCHSLSIEHHIPTIAVLGWGLWRYSKRPERHTIQQIVEAGGLVLSEYRLWDQPTLYSFPQRNRIIAGVSDLLFLPEASKKSWSLITVDFALAMQTPVFATPSSIFSPTSEGILHLIETGHVKPIIDLQNFIHQHFSLKNISSRLLPSITFSEREQSLVSVLSHDQWCTIQWLVSATWHDIQTIIQILTMLEIKGVIRQDFPGNYLLT